MDRNHLERCIDSQQATAADEESPFVSLEAEIPEVLYRGAEGFHRIQSRLGSVPGDELRSGAVPIPERLLRACGHRALSG